MPKSKLEIPMPKGARRPVPERTYFLEVVGNNGGSYVRLTQVREGVVCLDVGETCVHTVDEELSVVALAAILTWAKDYGFERILTELDQVGGSIAGPAWLRNDLTEEKKR